MNMKYLWRKLDGLPLPSGKKYNRCIAIVMGIGLLFAGVLGWGLALPGQTRFLLVGYAVLLAPVWVFFYGCRHPFGNGRK